MAILGHSEITDNERSDILTKKKKQIIQINNISGI